MAHKKEKFWQVKMESQHRGYLKMSVRHEEFDSEKRAWNYVERMKKKFPECRFYIGEMRPATVRQEKLDLDNDGYPDGIDF
jgi:hypothetical protein